MSRNFKKISVASALVAATTLPTTMVSALETNVKNDSNTPVTLSSERRGWYEEYGYKYYYDDNGELLKGLQEIDGNTYYFYSYDGHMAYSSWYDEDTITDQPMRQIVSELIREKALHALNEEIPHGIAVVIDSMKERKGRNGKITDIQATIICERDSHKGIIIGKGGSMLKKIGANARYEIEKQLDMKVNLQLWVKVKKEWRDSDILIKNFGYDKKKD